MGAQMHASSAIVVANTLKMRPPSCAMAHTTACPRSSPVSSVSPVRIRLAIASAPSATRRMMPHGVAVMGPGWPSVPSAARTVAVLHAVPYSSVSHR